MSRFSPGWSHSAQGAVLAQEALGHADNVVGFICLRVIAVLLRFAKLSRSVDLRGNSLKTSTDQKRSGTGVVAASQLDILESRITPSSGLAGLLALPSGGNLDLVNNTGSAIVFGAPTPDAKGDLYDMSYTFDASTATTTANVFEIPVGTKTHMSLGTFTLPITNQYPTPASVVVDGNGNVYGTTLNGGDNSLGSIFKVAAGTNQVQTMASFDQDIDGREPRRAHAFQWRTLRHDRDRRDVI